METTKNWAVRFTTVILAGMMVLLASCDGNKGRVITVDDFNDDWIVGDWEMTASANSKGNGDEGSAKTYEMKASVSISGKDNDSAVTATGEYINGGNAAYWLSSLKDVKTMFADFIGQIPPKDEWKWHGIKITGGDPNLHINKTNDEITFYVAMKSNYTKGAEVRLSFKKNVD
ncbi:MAG: hypothetical protein IJ191_07900 [Treponema sp.]|nr:hypothetical protein [Treponema sp.]